MHQIINNIYKIYQKKGQKKETSQNLNFYMHMFEKENYLKKQAR
jgi:hypothetical protein